MFVKYHLNRLIFFVNILAIVPLGCIVRFSHILPEYLAHIAGDIAYEILLVSIGVCIYPSANRRLIALWVFWITCGIELLKLYQAPWFQSIRTTLAGRLIFGSTFDWWNFGIYLFGTYLGWLWVRWLDPFLSKATPTKRR
jgi:Protein of unknown function (DUF2809)